MKLWLIESIDSLPADDDPWDPPYDKNFGFVIRAETEERAREIAAGLGLGDEMQGPWGKDAWLSAKYSTCVELTANGDEDIIIAC